MTEKKVDTQSPPPDPEREYHRYLRKVIGDPKQSIIVKHQATSLKDAGKRLTVTVDIIPENPTEPLNFGDEKQEK